MNSDKAKLRRFWKARLVSQAGDAGLTSLLEAWASRFDTILGTLALPGEPDLTAFYEFWLRRGRLGLARTNEDGAMDFGMVAALGPWTVSRGLREPPPTAPAWTPGATTLLLVPGLAFAPAPGGFVRLGRGGGYFDRWLAVHRSEVTAVGVGFPFQLTDTLPREPHDVLLDGYFDSEGFHGPASTGSKEFHAN